MSITKKICTKIFFQPIFSCLNFCTKQGTPAKKIMVRPLKFISCIQYSTFKPDLVLH